MIKILITGCNGFLGSHLVSYFSNRKYTVIGTSLNNRTHHNHLNYIPGDLVDKNFINTLIKKCKPDVVINTVALVDLDLCEVDEEKAFKTNVATAANIASALINHKIHLVHISTDQLFDGKGSFYNEIDKPKPLNVYGFTKLLSEKECLRRHSNTSVIRTNIMGWSPVKHKDTFAEWVYYSLKKNISINMFTDYYFTPIEVTIFANALERVIKHNIRGTFNIAGRERCSKYHFGVELAKSFGFDFSKISPCKVDSHNFKAKRQGDLSLSTDKFFKVNNFRLPNLSECLTTFKNNMPK